MEWKLLGSPSEESHFLITLRLTPDSRAPAKSWADAVLVLAFVLGAASSSASFSSSSSSPTFSSSASCSYCRLGPSWACLGPMLGLCWPTLALSWPYVGSMLPYVGPILAHVGPILAHVGPVLALCWPMLALCWPMLAHLGVYVGASLAEFLAIYVETPSRCKLFGFFPLAGAQNYVKTTVGRVAVERPAEGFVGFEAGTAVPNVAF